jgi:hypothetical protein
VGVKERGPNRLQISIPAPEGLPAHWDLYATTRTLNCFKLDSLPIRNGIAELELPDEAVFTLVGKP